MFRPICFRKNESFPKLFLNNSISSKYEKLNIKKFSILEICIIIRYAFFKTEVVTKSE